MALIPYPDIDRLSDGARRIVTAAPQNIARMMAGSGDLFEPLMGFAVSFLKHGILPATLREAVTYRIAHRYAATYVLDQHTVMARAVGLKDSQLEALRGPLPSPAFDERDNAALLLIDAQIDSVRPDEAIVLQAYALLGETAFHELLLVAGFYHMSVHYTETIRIEADAGIKGNALDNVDRLDAPATDAATT